MSPQYTCTEDVTRSKQNDLWEYRSPTRQPPSLRIYTPGYVCAPYTRHVWVTWMLHWRSPSSPSSPPLSAKLKFFPPFHERENAEAEKLVVVSNVLLDYTVFFLLLCWSLVSKWRYLDILIFNIFSFSFWFLSEEEIWRFSFVIWEFQVWYDFILIWWFVCHYCGFARVIMTFRVRSYCRSL